MTNRMQSNPAVKPFLSSTEEEGPVCSPVQYCSKCGHYMEDPNSFILEYWRADQTVYFCWCHTCGHRWELVEVTMISATEMSEGDEDF